MQVSDWSIIVYMVMNLFQLVDWHIILHQQQH